MCVERAEGGSRERLYMSGRGREERREGKKRRGERESKDLQGNSERWEIIRGKDKERETGLGGKR